MAQDDDVLSQADALMRRHRSFVARVAEKTDEESAAVTTDSATSDIDIPVLTEVVDVSATVPLDLAAILHALRDDIESELSEWLVEVLPAAVANASQNILTELDAKARHTLLPRLLEILDERKRNAEQRSSTLSV